MYRAFTCVVVRQVYAISIAESRTLSVHELAELSDTLSSPDAIPYLFGLPHDQREEISDIALAFSSYSVSTLRNRIDMLLYGTGERLIHKAVRKLLPRMVEQFQYFVTQAHESDRERYENRIGERYLELCHNRNVCDQNEQADAKVMANIAISQVLSREVLGHLNIPGLQRFDTIQQLEERPETSRGLGQFLIDSNPKRWHIEKTPSRNMR